MGYWVELRCDVGAPPQPYDIVKGRYPKCYSESNAGPKELVDALPDAKKIIAVEARKQGWRNIKGKGWVCPYCQTQSSLVVV